MSESAERLEDRMRDHGEDTGGIRVEWRFNSLYLFDPMDKALIVMDCDGAAQLMRFLQDKLT